MACMIAGLALLGAQAGIDLASGKAAFGTLQAYLEENAGGAAKYGASPWYNTWLLVLGIALFPFSARVCAAPEVGLGPAFSARGDTTCFCFRPFGRRT